MPDYPSVLDRVYDRYLQWEADVQAVQDAYMSEHGRYVEAVQIVSQIPADGNERTPDRSSKAKSDFPHSWEDLAPSLPQSVMSGIQIDCYEGPQGWGYIAVLKHVVAGEMWMRRIDYGPEGRSRDWYKLQTN